MKLGFGLMRFSRAPVVALAGLLMVGLVLGGCAPAEDDGAPAGESSAPGAYGGGADAEDAPADAEDMEESAGEASGDSAEEEAPEPEAAGDEAATGDSASAAASASAGPGVSGRVVFEGDVPEPPVLDTSADEKCAAMHEDDPLHAQALVVGDNGGVQNCFAYIKNPPNQDYAVPEEPAVLDQKGCTYEPHVLGLMASQTLEVRNSDPTLHNVRGFCQLNRSFNMGQPAGSSPRTRKLDQPEKEIKVKCDIHPWMISYMFVMDHPYFAVSGSNGEFTIDGLPDGTYTLVVWQEKLGEQEKEITVEDGASTGHEFTLSMP